MSNVAIIPASKIVYQLNVGVKMKTVTFADLLSMVAQNAVIVDHYKNESKADSFVTCIELTHEIKCAMIDGDKTINFDSMYIRNSLTKPSDVIDQQTPIESHVSLFDFDSTLSIEEVWIDNHMTSEQLKNKVFIVTPE